MSKFKQPANMVEIFLQPGDFYFGDRDTRIRTLLGSCVSITMWHPKLLVGGMCHYLLPARQKNFGAALDGHYAEEAMQLFLKEIIAAKTRPSEYQVKLFGGSNMFSGLDRRKLISPEKIVAGKAHQLNVKRVIHSNNVPSRNVDSAYALIETHGFKIHAEDLGGNAHRQLFFDIWSGDAWVRKPGATLI